MKVLLVKNSYKVELRGSDHAIRNLLNAIHPDDSIPFEVKQE